MNNLIRYKTSSPSGDLISFLSGIKKVGEDTGKQAIIYHRLNAIGGSYEGADSAYEDENKNPIMFNKYCFDMMRPLLLYQDYIEDYIVFEGQEYDVDLDKIRLEHFTNQPKGSLNRYFNYVFPDMASDLSQKYLNVRDIKINGYYDKIILNFTVRHRNSFITYFFLKDYQDKLIFAGLKKERDLFCKEWNLDIPLLEVSDFLQLAIYINSCKFFMGCQSFVFQLAEALKVPRILELFPMMPNVIPTGSDAYDAYHEDAIKFYFNKLINK